MRRANERRWIVRRRDARAVPMLDEDRCTDDSHDK